ncbi:MAG: SDR family NAD(P)-dependent oxidoreductase [Proteobacteria bacterium]|nr:SDR family NAD(P)-dependent oxidoreductase [Pseudomonadota bacterium]
MMNLKEKYGPWALVTGGTSGIGSSLCKLIAEQGVNIVLVARRAELLETKSEELKKKYGIEVKTIGADLSKKEEVAKVKNGTKDMEIGLLIPCAGIENHGLMTDINLESDLGMLQLNVMSTFELVHHFAGKMVPRKQGGILLVSSMIGHMPNPYFSNYAASKAYVLNFGASLHWEMKQRGIDVTVLSPGYTLTPMTDILNDEMDVSKLPMPPMSPEYTAKVGLEGLGKTAVVIPGKKNKFMVFMATRVASLASSISMGGKMMEKVMPSLSKT